ncbi:hypothetical protein TVAG_203390 [Trichomonas vaginalis G3]|uniref:Uncharacterized protein n=1 Tax=Trichomonas vaginalis (strain ATCC PRA-98 / G3) TaxID=412133 RepID=A2FNH4_TRIV3|nr:hypothetical protein TVAGG3_0619390 [Trichomonas vaginalis G3]EAX93548.1 hypothetical protein TVAG_203390 [Trichomonas vaginalis G3]KAI5503784.1 hypothetical protein TVAGG3_0619390 [Trichomonas vaginalis G3]|eukprot:XP_001306478.1 hypothetical protein [Trichomonas vaginalis G3]
MIGEKLPPLSPNAPPKPSNSSDIFVIAQLRGEMMKVQQSIQRLSSDYAQLDTIIPENIAQTINQLESNCNILDTKVTSETSRDWISELNELEKNINAISSKYSKFNNKTNKNIHSQQFAKSCTTFEMELNKTNEEFLNKLERDIMNQIAQLKGEIPQETKEEEEDPLKLTAMMVEVQEKTSKERIFIEKRTDPELTARVRRHVDRVNMIEDLIKYNMNNYTPAQSQPVADIKKKNEEIEAILADVREKVNNLTNENIETQKPKDAEAKPVEEPVQTLTRDEMLKFSASINTSIQGISLESQQLAETILKQSESIVDQIDQSGKKLHTVALEAEKSLKRAEGISEHVEIISSVSIAEQPEVTEEDVKKAAKTANNKVQKVIKDVDQRLKIINDRINKVKAAAVKDQIPTVNET